MAPLISILIPAYNCSRWISQTLQSAIGQTWHRKEIIVVDDGSTDNTWEVAQEVRSSIVRIARQENQGPSAARNAALSLAQGDYLQWLDGDDLLHPEKLYHQMAAIGAGTDAKALLSGPWGSFVHRPHRAVFTPTALWHDLDPTQWLLRKMKHNLFMTNSSWLVSRELTNRAGPWDVKQTRDNDGEYFCRVLLCSSGVRFVPSAKVYYRQTGSGSVSHTGRSLAKLDATWRSLKLHVGYLRSLEDSTRVRQACIEFLQRWVVEFYPYRPDLIGAARELAQACGGDLEEPRLSWKYERLRRLAGWDVAKTTQGALRNMRAMSERSVDLLLSKLDSEDLWHGSAPAMVAWKDEK